MKLASLNPFRIKQVLAATCFFAMSAGSHAASNTWLGTTNSNWDTSTANWTSPTAWANGNDAVFGTTGAGALTVGASVTAHNLTFNANGYTIQGAGLTLVTAGATIDTAPGVSANISSIIGGSVGLTKTSAGTLTLSGLNNYTGTTAVNGGTLILSPTTTATSYNFSSTSYTLSNSSTLRFDLSNIGTNSAFLNAGLGTINTTGGTVELYTTSTLHSGYSPQNAALLVNTTFSGTGNLNKEGAGTIDFLDSNTLASFTGAININGGTLSFQMTTTGQYSGHSALNIAAGATADVRVSTLFVDALNGVAGSLVSCSFNSGNVLSVGNNGGGGTFAGVIQNGSSGGLAFTKNGAGTQTLSGLNTYTGVTKISNGALSIGTINNGGIAGNLGAATNAAGNLLLDGGTLQYTGATDSTDRAFTITALKTGTIEVTNASTNLTISGAGANTTGSLTKTGAGTLTLTGTNLYTGITSVNAGRLNVTGSLSSSPVSVNSGGTLMGNGITTGALTLNSGSIILGGATGTTFRAASVTVNTGAKILGTDGLATAGVGRIMGIARYTSGTGPTGTGNFDTTNYRSPSVNNVGGAGGETQLTYTANAETWDNAVTSGTWVAGGVNWTGSDTHYFDGDLVTFGSVTAGTSVTLNTQVTPGSVTFTNANAMTITGTGGITGTTALTKSGAGKLTLTTNNSYTGATAINGGTLQLGDGTAGNDGTLSGTTVTVGGSGTLSYNINGNQTVSYGITGATGATLIKDGAGTLTLSGGTGAVNFGNDGSSLQVKNGRLIYTNIGNGTGLYQKSIDISSGATLEMNVAASTTNAIGAWDGSYTGTGTLIKSGAGTLDFGYFGVSAGRSVNFGTGALIWVQGGTLIGTDQTVLWTNNHASMQVDSGATFNANGGTIRVDSLTGAGSVSLPGGSLTVGTDGGGGIFTGAISGTGTFTKTGAGTQTLSGANLYSGLTTVSQGELDLNKTGGQSIAGNLTVSGGTAKLLQADQIASGKNLVVSSGTFNIQGFNQSLANVQLTGGSINGSGGTLTSTNAYDMQSGSVSAILGGSGVALNKGTGGTVTLTGANTYTGATTITTGTLQVDGSLASGSTVGIGTAGTLSGTGTINGNATLTGGGTINKSSGTIAGTLAVTGGNWNGAGSVTGAVTSSSGTFTIGSGANLTANGGLNVTGGSIASGSGTSTITGSVNYTSANDSSFGGVIAGSSKTLTMNNSAATLTLTGTSSYSGATNVNAGKLVVNGNISTSILTTVNSGGTLGGSGTVGVLTVLGTGIVAPGNSPGILNSGNYTQTAGTLSLDLNGTTVGVTGGYDQLNVTGTVQLGGALAAASGGSFANGALLFILANDGGDSINGTFSGMPNLSIFNLGGQDWQISYTGNYVSSGSPSNNFLGGNDVVLMAVPEPSSAAALIGGLGMLSLLRRRRA